MSAVSVRHGRFHGINGKDETMMHDNWMGYGFGLGWIWTILVIVLVGLAIAALLKYIPK
jgi:hypothetical protein